MFNKISLIALSLTLGTVTMAPWAYGASTTTTVETSNTETSVTPRSSKKVRPTTTTTSTSNTSATTTVKVEPRQALTEDTLKKISSTLCTEGFKAYVGTNKKNVCQSQVIAPDIAYSCVWKKKGTAVYAPSAQGPCTLDYTKHRGNINISKERFSSNPPLAYGVDAECCYRAAVGSMTSN